jgi:lauroyl/myristoyl acyltransferase
MMDRMTAATYFTGWWIVRTLPEAVAYKVFSGIADFAMEKASSAYVRIYLGRNHI